MLGLVQLPYPEPELTYGLVSLRRWALTDVDCVRLAATDQRIPRGTTVPAVFSPEEGRAFIERQWGRQTGGEGLSLAIASDGQASGMICALFRSQAGVVGIGYFVVPPARGHGYAQRAIKLLSTWLLRVTPTTRVEAIVEPHNLPSRRSLERCGFVEEGTLRQYLAGQHDVVSYSLLLSDLDGLAGAP